MRVWSASSPHECSSPADTAKNSDAGHLPHRARVQSHEMGHGEPLPIVVVVSPASDTSVGEQPTRMLRASGYDLAAGRHRVIFSDRLFRTASVHRLAQWRIDVSLACDGAVGPDGAGESWTGRHGHISSGRCVGLAEVVLSPAYDCAVGPDGA